MVRELSSPDDPVMVLLVARELSSTSSPDDPAAVVRWKYDVGTVWCQEEGGAVPPSFTATDGGLLRP